MSQTQKDDLKLLLRQFELPLPPPDFTSEVMRETSPLSEEAPLDLHLKTVLQDIRPAEPSAEFTFKVQKEIRKLAQPSQSKPVITWGAWLGILAFLIVCVVMSINPSQGTPADGPIYFTKITKHITGLTTTFHEPLIFIEATLSAAALLLALERLLRRGFHSKKQKRLHM
ncbi:MAG: hypothetical protein QM762_23155 [Chryseolinea sp.]